VAKAPSGLRPGIGGGDGVEARHRWLHQRYPVCCRSPASAAAISRGVSYAHEQACVPRHVKRRRAAGPMRLGSCTSLWWGRRCRHCERNPLMAIKTTRVTTTAGSARAGLVTTRTRLIASPELQKNPKNRTRWLGLDYPPLHGLRVPSHAFRPESSPRRWNRKLKISLKHYKDKFESADPDDRGDPRKGD